MHQLKQSHQLVLLPYFHISFVFKVCWSKLGSVREVRVFDTVLGNTVIAEHNGTRINDKAMWDIREKILGVITKCQDWCYKKKTTVSIFLHLMGKDQTGEYDDED